MRTQSFNFYLVELLHSTNKKSPDVQLPIYVDLDGTLVNTDTLYESIIGLLTVNILFLFILPFWLLGGKARFKFRIGQHFNLDVNALPYNRDLIQFLREEKDHGSSLILATASTQSTATNIATHLGIFDDVLASNERENLKGKTKLAAIKTHCHNRPFTYIGNSTADIAIWHDAQEIIVAGRTPVIIQKLNACNLNVLKDFSTSPSLLAALLQAMRPHQWSKNFLVFISLILAQKFTKPESLVLAITAWAAFSACSSGIYLFNDLLDLDADRHHKDKQFRPLACGNLPIKHALLAAPLLIMTGAILATPLPLGFKTILACYTFTTICYSLFLKRIVLLDVIVLSLLYTIRIIAGSAAIGISTTPWLLGFSLFIFLSLALAKRYSELVNHQSLNNSEKIRGRGYNPEDIEQLAIFGSASGYISVLVLALYINSTASMALYKKPEFLWPICVLLIYWISRVWLLARRGQLDEDPVVFTLRDKTSYFIGVITAMLLFLAVHYS